MKRITFALAMLAVLVSAAANADPIEDFYKGKNLRMLIGYGPGGGYDLYARLVARHMGRFIPGNPTLVVQNMPGAGSLRATNFIYNVAPKDGTLFGIFARNMPLLGILGGNPAVQFDPRRFTWIGSSSSFEEDAYVLFLRPDAANKSIEDARRPGGPPLVLGGVEIDAPGLLGHSDADVVAHAVADALLGAAALGDIGTHFPDSDPRWRGADSIALLGHVAGLVTAGGWSIGNVDTTVILEVPKLAPHKAAMAQRLTGTLGAPVSVKAKRAEGLGSLGRGEGIACFAVALLVR